MKTGIVATGDPRFALTLFYYLKLRSCKPECIILIKRNIFSKIKRASFPRILDSLQERCNNRQTGQRRCSRDYLAEFARRQEIKLPGFSLSRICKIEKMRLFITDDVNNSRVIDYLRNAQIDLLLNTGGGLYKSEVISTVRTGILNAHMGPLPEFRGMNVMEWSLFYGRDIGVTLHFIDKGIDTGDILMFKTIPVESGDTIEDLRNKSGIVNIELFYTAIKCISENKLERTTQLKDEGKQYFVMHPRLRSIVENRLSNSFVSKI